MLKRILIVSTVVSFLFINVMSAKADMYTYNFEKITNNSYLDLGDQLRVEVSDSGSNQVLFTFYNDIGIRSSICDIYFDDDSGSLKNMTNIINETGVRFNSPAHPRNLPGGRPFSFRADFSADSDVPVKHNGINFSTESLGLKFNLASGYSFSDVINALADECLRIGLHVQAIGYCDKSDSYINEPGDTPVVPVPGAAILGFLGISLAGIKLRKTI